MPKKKYFAQLTSSHLVPKNQLQKAIRDLFSAHHHKLIHGDLKLDDLILELKHSVDKLNRSHQRCRPLAISTLKSSEISQSVYVPGVIGLSFLTVIEEVGL